MLNTSSKYLLEVACFNVESCLIAQEAGADRIEFCADYNSGGITPNYEDILKARELLHIPLHVIIRPRKGSFVYTSNEFETMRKDILFCKEHKIDGVVLGVLNSNSTINFEANKELVELAKPMSTTFHRAIDACVDIEKALEDIIQLGFHKVLSSGGKQTASEGVSNLKVYNEKFGKHIIIIPAGGIRIENINFILTETKTKEIHSAAIIADDELVDGKEVAKLKDIIELFAC